jgi:CheY-like chemotaxis protein
MATILVVDDSGFQRKVLSSILISHGYTVVQAAGGREAIGLVGDRKPDLILLDILMPDMTGIDVLKELRRTSPKIPVAMVSSDIQKATRQECFALGAVEFFNKPVDRELLLDSIQRILTKG